MRNRIIEARNHRGLNQAKVAELIGISDSAYSRLEKGVNNPSDRTVMLFCQKLHISETWLRTGEGEMEEQTPASLVDALANEYNLNPGCVALLRAVARAFEVLDDTQRDLVLDQLMSDLQAYTANRQMAGVTVPAPQTPADEESSSSSSGSVVG